MTVLWLEIYGVFLDFSVIYSVTSAESAYDVGVTKPIVHDLRKSSCWKFDLKEDKLELEFHN